MKRKIILVFLGILIVMLGVLRISYAFIKDKVSESAISNVEINTCAKLQLIEDSNSINLENTYPMEDSMGLETKPYEFTISSTCEVSVGFSIYITSISESTINESYIKYAIKDERGEVVEENIIGKSEDGSKDYNEEEIKELEVGIKGKVKNIYKIYSDRVTYSVDKKYYLYLWIDSQATEETVPMGSIYKAGITIKTDNGSEKQPFIIKTIEDIVNLSNSVNKGTSYENEYIVLSKDLDFRNPSDYEDSLRTDYGDINGNGITVRTNNRKWICSYRKSK